MKILKLLMCSLIFNSICFGQNAFVAKTNQFKDGLKPKFQKAKVDLKIQLVKTEYFIDIEGGNSIDNDAEYKYNKQGKQTETIYTDYDLGLPFDRTKEQYSYLNDTQITLFEEFDYNFGFQDFELNRYTEYEYNSNKLQKTHLFENNLGVFEKTEETVNDYDASGLLMSERRRTEQNGMFSTLFKTSYTYYNDNTLKSETEAQCNNDTVCTQNQVIDYTYTNFGRTDTNIYSSISNGQKTPFSRDLNVYNTSNKLILEGYYERYDESTQSFVPDERYRFFYNQNDVLDSIYIEIYNQSDQKYSLDTRVSQIDYTTNLTSSEILLPQEFDEEFSIFYALFAYQLNSYEVEYGNFENGDTDKDKQVFTYSTFTSVTENENFAFTLSPNPTADVLNIQLKDGSANKVFVFNNLGQTMLQQNITDNNFTIDTKNLKPDVYFVKIISNNSFLTERFVKL